jgi:predicted Zn-dependent protease
MSPRRISATASILVCAALLASAACSSSPKQDSQKPKRTVLHTRYDDARVGREASRGVAAQMGLMNDPALDAYVSELGRKLLRGIPRRSFQYQFKVVDQFEPNAFALPGGYIFVSRGLLVLANDEDEMANVIGHEITHSARRHAAAQQQLARRQNPLAMGWARNATVAAYGRDMEREADRGGQILAAAAGYDPMGMSTFLSDMGNMERLMAGYARLPTFLDTHPTSQDRAAANAVRAREIRWKRDPTLGDTRASHLRRIDGLAVGQRPETGVFVGDDFLHPDMDFRIRFPHGWRTSNSTQVVGAMAPRGDAVVMLMADQPAGDPREMAQACRRRRPRRSRSAESTPGGWSSRGAAAPARSSSPRPLYRIAGRPGASPACRWPAVATARSFRPLTEAERASIQATRLRVVTARPGEGLAELGRRTGNAWDPSSTAVYNGIFVDHRFEGGELVKVVKVEAY